MTYYPEYNNSHDVGSPTKNMAIMQRAQLRVII
jgi:hypothetical protein